MGPLFEKFDGGKVSPFHVVQSFPDTEESLGKSGQTVKKL